MNKTAWKTDDKAWMKQRRKDWEYVKKRLYKFKYLKKGDINNFLRSYYLKGTMSLEEHKAFFWADYNCEMPLLYAAMEAPVLLECWLNPDQSEENWRCIQSAYTEGCFGSSRRRFLEKARVVAEFPRIHYLNEGDYFGGLEEKLYRFLCPTRCRREDYPEHSEDRFKNDIAVWCIHHICNELVYYFESEFPNAKYVVHYRLEELSDALKVSPQAFQGEGKEVLIKIIGRILAHPAQYPDVVTKIAKRVEDVLLSPDLPAEVKEYFFGVYSKSSSLEERVIYSAKAGIYIRCPSVGVCEQFMLYLAASERPKIPNNDYGIYGELYEFRWPRVLKKEKDKHVYIEIDLGVLGEKEVAILSRVTVSAGCEGLFCYFDNPECNPAYYEVVDEGKLNVLYMPGDDEALDKKIATFASASEALPLVVDIMQSNIVKGNGP